MGSGISLNTFVDRAKLSESSDMRMSRDGQQLINKGSLGQKIASFFTGIGQALGVVKETRGNEASVRQETALGGFREALQKEFGTTIANQALSSRPGLTGRVVLQAVKDAQSEAKIATYHNARFTVGEELPKAAQKLGVDLKQLTASQRTAFEDHFEKAKSTALAGNLHRLDFGKVADMAEDALRKALGKPSLQDLRGLESVKSYGSAMKQTLSDSFDAHGRSQLTGTTMEVVDRFMLRAVREMASLPRDQGPGPFNEAHERLTTDLRDFLDYASRRNQMDNQNLDAQAKSQTIQYFSGAMQQLVKGF